MKKQILRIALLTSFILITALRGEEPAAPAISLEEALKLGAEGIATKRGDESEAGLDAAAVFYATAKRMQTEQKLGSKDLSLVLDLDLLRQASIEWLDAWYEGMYYVSGGGTMWAHQQSRSLAKLEDTLAELATRMPLKPGNASAETLSEWGKLEGVIAKAKIPSDADPETKATWKPLPKLIHEKWERFHFEFQALDDADAKLLLKMLMPSAEELEGMAGK